ncbi:MAG: hypothetical protein ACOY4L_11675 [Pseudomonadota bacterium]
MEWLYLIKPPLAVSRIEEVCTLAALPTLCEDVYEVSGLREAGREGRVDCVWGVFDGRCLPIRNGVRYELVSCPNALQWTVTSRNGEMTLHGSINMADVAPDFAESIELFLGHFRDSLQQLATADGYLPVDQAL